MSKKLFIIIISVVLGLFLVSLLGYYFILQNNQGGSGGIVSTFKNFFPFGGNQNPTTQPFSTTTETTPPPQNNQQNFTQKLRELSVEPIAGAGVLDVKAGTVVRYIEKATGHIFEVELFSPNTNRISNTTIPVVYDAIWGNKNNSLLARYLKNDNQTVDTYSLTVKGISTTTENTISGILFPPNISDVSVFGSSVFYLQQNGSFSVGYISSFDTKKKSQIWNSPITELLSQYVNAKTVALTTKPDQSTAGFLYFVDTGNGQVKNILGNISGLSVLVNDTATQVLYLYQGNGVGMGVYDVKSKLATTTSPTTFPEKCVWSKKDKSIIYCAVPKEFLDENSLTSWYKGMISFTDDIWKYDLKKNTSTLVEDLSNNAGTAIDVIKPILSDNEQYLVFMNKIDNTLWSLDLNK